MAKPDPKQAWVDDVNFIFAECRRIQAKINEDLATAFTRLTKAETGASLPHPGGTGEMFCGVDAWGKVRQLALGALERSEVGRTVEPEVVVRALPEILVERFLREERPVTVPQVEKALSAAVRAAKRHRGDRLHVIPCRLTRTAGTPFAVGPVAFNPRVVSILESLFERYVASEEPGETWSLPHVARAREYYEGFAWTAEVTILNCDPGVSRQRAELAVQAGVDFLHVLFGAYHTGNMAAGGARRADDRRAHVTVEPDQSVSIETSSSATSAVGFQSGWEVVFEREDYARLVSAAGKSIEAVTDPSVDRPVGLRFVDAAAWFGDGVREASDAARVVKCMTAIERLVLTEERDRVTDLVCGRAAALCYDPHGEEALGDLKRDLEAAYDLRSRLVHGTTSPFDPEVAERSHACARRAERVLINGLHLFDEHHFLEGKVSTKNLGAFLNGLVDWAERVQAAKEAGGLRPLEG